MAGPPSSTSSTRSSLPCRSAGSAPRRPRPPGAGRWRRCRIAAGARHPLQPPRQLADRLVGALGARERLLASARPLSPIAPSDMSAMPDRLLRSCATAAASSPTARMRDSFISRSWARIRSAFRSSSRLTWSARSIAMPEVAHERAEEAVVEQLVGQRLATAVGGEAERAHRLAAAAEQRPAGERVAPQVLEDDARQGHRAGGDPLRVILDDEQRLGALDVDHPPLAEAVADRLPHVEDRDPRHLLGGVAPVDQLAHGDEVAASARRGRRSTRPRIPAPRSRSRRRPRCRRGSTSTPADCVIVREQVKGWFGTCSRGRHAGGLYSQSAVAPLRFDPSCAAARQNPERRRSSLPLSQFRRASFETFDARAFTERADRAAADERKRERAEKDRRQRNVVMPARIAAIERPRRSADTPAFVELRDENEQGVLVGDKTSPRFLAKCRRQASYPVPSVPIRLSLSIARRTCPLSPTRMRPGRRTSQSSAKEPL